METFSHSKLKKMNYTWYCIFGTLLYYFSCSFFCYGCIKFLGQYDTNSKFIEKWYFRGEDVYDTMYVSGAKFWYYWIMNLIGFTFVNVVNLQNERHCPILDAHMSPASFYKTALIVSPVLFIVSMNVNLRAQNDISQTFDISVT